MESVFDWVFKVLQILLDIFKSSIVDSMCNFLIAFVFVVSSKVGNSWVVGGGGGGVQRPSGTEIPGGWGGGGSKVNKIDSMIA